MSLLALLVVGCGGYYDVRATTVMEPIQAPATAKRGEMVTLRLVASGNSSCESYSRLEISPDHVQRRVSIIPYVQSQRGVACAQAATAVPMTVYFTPTATGTYVIEAKGVKGFSHEPTVWTANIEVTD
jgi:hypothetical protein